MSVRQFKRLVWAWKQEGDAGQVSHNRLEAELRDRITALPRDKYADFGLTLGCGEVTGTGGDHGVARDRPPDADCFGALEAEEPPDAQGVPVARPPAAVCRTDPD